MLLNIILLDSRNKLLFLYKSNFQTSSCFDFILLNFLNLIFKRVAFKSKATANFSINKSEKNRVQIKEDRVIAVELYEK